jgi:hypothetical protein
MFFENENSNWGARFVRHFYEKDKLIAIDPRHIPEIDDEKLMAFPVGYRHLAYCQETCFPGLQVKRDMPGWRGEEHDKLLWQAKEWLEGKDVQI